MWSLLVIILIVYISEYGLCSYSNPPSKPVRKTQNGYIMGTTLLSRNGNNFSAFMGIPYAQPPVGNLRFKAPKPMNPWNGTLDCTRDGPFCIQKKYLSANPAVEGQEDCLYLNVYVPEVSNGKAVLPVIVHIHWGGFFEGKGTSDFTGPKYIMDKNVILVTFNYRLGIFGFLSTLDDEAPGNYALKDQVEALRWVQKNIINFNGDPQRVTLFGASAGAASVHLHMLSPLSKGLFQRAISESGVGLALWSTPSNEVHKQVLSKQSKISGCSEESSEMLMKCLRELNAKDLVESGELFKYFTVNPLMPYTMVIEKRTRRNSEPFLTKLPIEYIKTREFLNIPWIVGVTQNEGNVWASPLVRQSDTRNALNANFTALMIKLASYDQSVGSNKKDQLDLHKEVQAFYMNGQEFINIEDHDNIQGFVDFWSDREINYPTYQSVMLHSALGHKPIWIYSFEYEGKNTYESLWAATNETVPFKWGTSHCDELLYLFDSPDLFPENVEGRDEMMMEILLDRWTNFAIYGDPQRTSQENYWNSLNFSGIENMKNENFYLLNITGSLSKDYIRENMQQGFHKMRMLFWASKKLVGNFGGLQ